MDDVKFDPGQIVPCKHIFSNGTEYMLFLEHYCFRCKRFRKWRCRIVRRIEWARFDESYFPYDDLLEYEHVGGKECKSFTTVPLKRRRRRRKEIEGQMVMGEFDG